METADCTEFYGQFDSVYVPIITYGASYGFAFRQLPEQSNSEDVSLSVPGRACEHLSVVTFD